MFNIIKIAPATGLIIRPTKAVFTQKHDQAIYAKLDAKNDLFVFYTKLCKGDINRQYSGY